MEKGARRSWPLHGWIGLGLILIFWPLNWLLPGLRSHWGFFPLWLGYCLFVDALAFRQNGDSPFTRDRRAYAALFLVSAPAWWLFELFNLRTQNWIYLGREAFSDLQYAIFATLSFSTVMPAVFGTAEWVSGLPRLRNWGRGPVLRKSRPLLNGMAAAGGVMLLLLMLWPDLFFPFLWGAIYLLVEPLNAIMGRRTLLDDLERGDWRPALSLSAGCLICGFFWEMWNFCSYPKWIYRIPYLGSPSLFEMPLAGYLGYPPFSWELFSLYNLVSGPQSGRGIRLGGP